MIRRVHGDVADFDGEPAPVVDGDRAFRAQVQVAGDGEAALLQGEGAARERHVTHPRDSRAPLVQVLETADRSPEAGRLHAGALHVQRQGVRPLPEVDGARDVAAALYPQTVVSGPEPHRSVHEATADREEAAVGGPRQVGQAGQGARAEEVERGAIRAAGDGDLDGAGGAALGPDAEPAFVHVCGIRIVPARRRDPPPGHGDGGRPGPGGARHEAHRPGPRYRDPAGVDGVGRTAHRPHLEAVRPPPRAVRAAGRHDRAHVPGLRVALSALM